MSGEVKVVQIPLLVFDAFARDMHDAALTGAAALEKLLAADNPKAEAAIFATAFEQFAHTFVQFTNAAKQITVPPLLIAWTVNDVQTLFDCSEEQALELLADHHVEDRMIELGWGVLETIGQIAGLPLTDMWKQEKESRDNE